MGRLNIPGGTRAAVLVGAIALVAALAGCAPQVSGKPDGGQDSPSGATSVAVQFSETSECGACHSAQQGSRDDASCLAGLHPQNECLDCHTYSEQLEGAHEGVTTDSRTPRRLSATEVSDATCRACHDAEALVQATAASTECTDGNGLTVNPHDLPEAGDHDQVECWSCHGAHEAVEVVNDACVKCHHQNVYECYTCHE